MTSRNITRVVSLTEAQRTILTAAAERPDGALILPARLKGRAADTLVQALLGKALVREVRAKGEQPVWRKDADTGRGFCLVLTKAGKTAVAAQPEHDRVPDGADQPARATDSIPAPAAAGAAAFADTPAAPAVSAASAGPSAALPAGPRSGSKLAAITVLLGRAQGTSIAELMAATGWLPHTTRAALTGLRKRGYALTRETGENGAVYRIGAAPAATA